MIFFVSCNGNTSEDLYLPENLPSDETIKETLSSDSSLAKLNAKAKLLEKSLATWKEEEKTLVSEKDINLYWQKEKKSTPKSILDTDLIDRQRDSIRIRIVWSRIFHKTGITLKQKQNQVANFNLFKQLNFESSPQFGSSDAKWIIVEWSDYLCNFCRESFPHTKNLLSKYKTQIMYIHKDFPLDGDSDESLLPLALGRCLWENDPKNFLGHMQLLYSNSKKIMRGDNLQVKEWDFLQDCQPKSLSLKYFSQVKSDMKEAMKFGVGSVPTFWVNGRWVVGALDSQSWERVLEDTASR
ncbi:oxidoreductase [Leptospira mtsangambouensis]|uniref:Oxidoreductase n=1 Tax=Leptospira mtsangambouensis TaxID=2484912 RepID=A0ABY2P180_9LEPT|nr:thioredoxin domain-containing protein [Leptospira mtsangambouensis]TGM78415.1 oxidoreductase [Leptospira mtsangambouensis]